MKHLKEGISIQAVDQFRTRTMCDQLEASSVHVNSVNRTN